MKLNFQFFFIVLIIIGNSPISAQETHYKTQAEIEKEKLEKFKIIKNSIAFSLDYGYFGLFHNAKANDNITNIDISDYHSMFNLTFEYYPYENLAAQLSVGLIYISQEQTIDSINYRPGYGLNGIYAEGSGKGGAILPVTLGIKKTFLKGLVRPYVSLLSGFTYIKIGSGTGSGGINDIEKNIDYYSTLKFTYQFCSGVQIKTGKVVRLDFGLHIYGTPNISPSIGGIDSYSGWYLFGGMNFILNPNRKKSKTR
ncbi:MAG TPA: hypothetical protein DCG75_12995 [Bacteroidales bacterium]|nr:hypothetical protein [Bacteroidales bacterium]